MGRDGQRSMGRRIHKCEAKAESEGCRPLPSDKVPPADVAPSALSSSSPFMEGCGFPKWVPSGSTK